MRKLVREIVTEFPEIRGYVLLTEGFYTGSRSARADTAMRTARLGARVGQGRRHCCGRSAQIKPAVEILPWEYNVAFSPDQVATKAYVMTQLPESTIPLLTFENGKGFDRRAEGLFHYAIDQVGPAEVTQAQFLEARKRGWRRLLEGGHVRQLAIRNVPLLALPVSVVCTLQGERSGSARTWRRGVTGSSRTGTSHAGPWPMPEGERRQ